MYKRQPSSKERFESATAMLDYGFATFEAGAFPQITGRADTLRVTGGVEQQVALDYTCLLYTSGGCAGAEGWRMECRAGGNKAAQSARRTAFAADIGA